MSERCSRPWCSPHQRVLLAASAGDVRDLPCHGTCGLGTREKEGSLTGRNPTGRGNKGSKMHVLFQVRGIPQALVVSAANTHDIQALPLWALGVPAVCSWRGPRGRHLAKLRADTANCSAEHLAWLRERNIVPRIVRRGIDSSERLGRHRWKIERSLSWLFGCRRLTVQYERKGPPTSSPSSASQPLIRRQSNCGRPPSDPHFGPSREAAKLGQEPAPQHFTITVTFECEITDAQALIENVRRYRLPSPHEPVGLRRRYGGTFCTIKSTLVHYRNRKIAWGPGAFTTDQECTKTTGRSGGARSPRTTRLGQAHPRSIGRPQGSDGATGPAPPPVEVPAWRPASTKSRYSPGAIPTLTHRPRTAPAAVPPWC
ncbi:transposase [Streptomyces sp. NPDC059009]|uniref:transposase n=1 Tax=Streptomyces sp. NPDC059009 TaxID=3346694 RepID=UPI0036BBEA9E